MCNNYYNYFMATMEQRITTTKLPTPRSVGPEHCRAWSSSPGPPPNRINDSQERWYNID